MSTSPKPSGARRPAKHWAVSTLRHYQPRGVRSQGRRPGRLERKGAVSVLAALFLTATAALVVLTLELGLPSVARAPWPCSANAAALTAATRCFDCASRHSDKTQRPAQQAILSIFERKVLVCSAPTGFNHVPRASGKLLMN